MDSILPALLAVTVLVLASMSLGQSSFNSFNALGDSWQNAEERTLETGSELIREGEPGREFFVVVDGEIEVRRGSRRVARLGAGSFVGEIALLSRSPRTATVVATTPLRVLAIEGRDFVELLDSLPELWLKVARALADRVDADEAAEALTRA